MLDRETRHRIDNARDILVGKVPDPKSQVEQITIALIYKFMNDMDRETQEQGGSRIFFAGEFEKYRWAKLMSPGMGGSEMLNLYAEAIEKMNENPGIPQLFRDIFKNAYLPYRDPETLRLFLKVIDEFRYTDSETLGDAFEYLLSVLDSQGDAGQFRTPRHIIDFIVDIVAPKKDELILDPACGTAGFLISSYNYIRKANAKDGKPGAALKPRERRRLADNISGYDIAPDMVRLALANMYLHGFREPRIYEYDTLTSEDRWNETADVILANPPFMTPKGGIRPHGRFSIQATRSEVLFVDYIAEHLSAKGRAAVIVPEGIIFQSGKAYKNLRKMLVGNYVVAVVSLPAGVFNPYSGVKTSVLFMDKSLAKKAGGILFVKVENDGYDLGAQRRRIDKNDLPAAARAIKARLTGNTVAPDSQNFASALTVARGKVNETTDWNLNGEMYREVEDIRHSDWPVVALGDVCDIQKGTAITKKQTQPGDIPVVAGGQTPAYFHNVANRDGDTVTVSGSGAYAGFVNFFSTPIFASDCSTVKANPETGETKFVYYLLKGMQEKIYALRKGMAQPHVYPKDIKRFKAPFPPLAVQREILAEINAHQKIIDGARQVVENYTPRIPIDPAWPTVKLGDVCELNPRKPKEFARGDEDETSFVPMEAVDAKMGKVDRLRVRPYSEVKKGYTYFSDGDVLFAKITPCMQNGKHFIAECLIDGVGFASTEFHVLRPGDAICAKWIYSHLTQPAILREATNHFTGSAGQQRVPGSFLDNLKIPLPSLAEQKRLVAEIEEEEKLIAANRTLIRAFEQKIKTKIAAVWGE